MPLKIGNYGDWEGDRSGKRPGGGYHPPACTCYICNEGRANQVTPNRTARAASRRRTDGGAKPVGSRPTARTNAPQHSGRRPIQPTTKQPNRRFRRVLWGSLALALAYTIYAGMGALDTYQSNPNGRPADLPGLLAQQAVVPLRGITDWFAETDRANVDRVTVPTTPVEPTPRQAILPPPTATARAGSGQGTTPPSADPPAMQSSLPEPPGEVLAVAMPLVSDLLAPTSTQALTHSPTATPLPTPTSVPTVTSQPSPTHTLTPVSTPNPVAHLRHIELKTYMLTLINKERAKAGVQPVTLGNNDAAQIQAESASASCTMGHWGTDGLKPYMRYSLAGGYQANSENASGLPYCFSLSEKMLYTPIASLQEEIDDTMESWMNSAGHRRTLLKPHWRKVSIGLAWNHHTATMYQQFEGDYVEYDQLPTLTGDMLTFSGKLQSGAYFDGRNSFGVQVYYDPPPHSLTTGQLARTYCATSGTMVAVLRAPPPANSHYNENSGVHTNKTCVDPYGIPADAPAPRSPTEAHEFARIAQASGVRVEQHPFRWITAAKLTAKSDLFSVRANLSKVLTKHGPGVYTVQVWAHWDGERIPVANHSLFHSIERPTHYGGGSP